MGMQLYDLAGAEFERRFSPYCWRIKLALMHKGLPFETIPWRFTDKNAIAFSGQSRVPALIDGDQARVHFWRSYYLEATYPDRPSLFRGHGGRAVNPICQCLGGCGFGQRHFAVDCDRHSHDRRQGSCLLPRDPGKAARRDTGSGHRRPRNKCGGVPEDLGAASHHTRSTALLRRRGAGVRRLCRVRLFPMGALHKLFCMQSLRDDPGWAWRERSLADFDGFAG